MAQAITWTNAGILLIGPLGTNFSEILIRINTFSFKKNVFENAVCKMVTILSLPRWVKLWLTESDDQIDASWLLHKINSLRPSDAYMRQ